MAAALRCRGDPGAERWPVVAAAAAEDSVAPRRGADDGAVMLLTFLWAGKWRTESSRRGKRARGSMLYVSGE